MPELLALPMTLIGIILVVGTLVEGSEKGFNNLTSEEKKYGFGLGSLLIFLAWFI